MSARLSVTALTAARRVLADRGALAVAGLFYLIVSVVVSSLWRAAAQAQGSVVGYSGAALTWYIFASEAAICAISVRLIEEIGDGVASGAVAVELLRPVPAVAVRLATEVGRALGRLGVLVVLGVPAAWWLAGPPPDASAALLSVASLLLAVPANVALQHVVAASAFWLRDTRATWFLYQKLVFILGGMLLPLQVLPDVLQVVAQSLPFLAMAYAPARLASGSVEPGLLAVQATWLVVLVGVATAIFAAGQRRLEVTGG